MGAQALFRLLVALGDRITQEQIGDIQDVQPNVHPALDKN